MVDALGKLREIEAGFLDPRRKREVVARLPEVPVLPEECVQAGDERRAVLKPQQVGTRHGSPARSLAATAGVAPAMSAKASDASSTPNRSSP